LVVGVVNLYQNKEGRVLNEVLNGRAKVSYEARALDSYTKEEVEQHLDLQQIFDEINEANITTTSHNNINVVNGELYTITVITSNDDEVIYRSLPRVKLMVSDVGTAGSTDINCKFEIIEYVSVNGDIEAGWQNGIKYKNISSEIACGDNTAFTSSMKISGETALKRNIMEAILGKDKFSNAMCSSDSEYNKNRNVTYENKYKTDLDEELYDDDHYLKIESSISTVDSRDTENQVTVASSQWTFEVCFYMNSISPECNSVKILCDTNYKVNMK
jgi:hypothetical protein